MSDAESRPPGAPLLEVRGVSKAFGHVQALNNVDLTVYAVEVVGLVGDNGAGKSTLMKIVCGALQPDSGTIMLDGQSVNFQSPADARARGITVVYQDLALVDSRDVAHNMCLGSLPIRAFHVDRRRMEQEARKSLVDLRIHIPSLRSLAGQLSGGQRQAVAIARAIRDGGRLMVMDEPTAALGVQEQRKVLHLIEDLRTHGKAVVVVSHNLQHVFSVADRIVVLRGGRLAGVRRKGQTSPEEIVKLIVGVEVLVPERESE